MSQKHINETIQFLSEFSLVSIEHKHFKHNKQFDKESAPGRGRTRELTDGIQMSSTELSQPLSVS